MQALADPAIKQHLADVGQIVVPVDQQSPAALGLTRKPRPRNGGRSSKRRI
jgi:hypothetical protein